MKIRWTTTICIALLAGAASNAAAQLATPSARSTALATSYAARARGYESSYWNPANLGLSDSPYWSVGIAGASAYLNNNSLSYSQISDLYGEYIDDATKSELLADIRRDDPDRMLELSFDVGAHVVGANIWRFAFGVSGIGAGSMSITPDAAELLLFGNVGEDGTGRDFVLEGSKGQAWSLSGAYLSYAQPFVLPTLLDTRFSVGATVKYGVAHGLVSIEDQGSILTEDPLALNVDAELIHSTDADAGRSWSFDLGAAMEWGDALVVGLAVTNVYSNISWNAEDFEITQYTIEADFDSSAANDTTLTFGELSVEDQERVIAGLEDLNLPRLVRLSGLYRFSSKFTLSGDYSELVGGKLRARWDRTIAVGGEFRPIDKLPLRIGLATDLDHFAYTGGFGVYGGPFHFDLSVGRWGVVGGDGVVGALSISFWPGPEY